MKKFIGKTREYLRTYWRNVMQSKDDNMSRGAEYVNRIITWARGDNWRRGREKKK